MVNQMKTIEARVVKVATIILMRMKRHRRVGTLFKSGLRPEAKLS